jgi:hypothetical protein
MSRSNYIIDSWYLSNDNTLNKTLRLTGLALDELTSIVGRFNKNSCRAGLLRGEVIVNVDNNIIIRHHFNKKVLWRKE